jgi:hypothetical protein
MPLILQEEMLFERKQKLLEMHRSNTPIRYHQLSELWAV